MTKKITLCLLSASLLTAVSAHAQKKDDYYEFAKDSVKNLNSVEVIAFRKEAHLNKIPVSLKKTPLTVNNLNTDVLLQRGITNLQTALKFVPGVNMSTSYGAFQRLSIRGFNDSPIMIDGVRDERTTINSYPFGDLYNVEKIEVLKGPASVLYGHSAVGGILNIVRKEPTYKRSLNAHLRYGSFNYREAALSLGGNITGPLNFYAGVFYSGGDHWRNTGDRRLSAYTALGYTHGAHKFVWRAEARSDSYGTEIGLPPTMPDTVYTADDNKFYLPKGAVRPGIPRDKRFNNESDFMYNKAWNTSLKYTYTINNDWKLSNYSSFSYDDIDYFGTEELGYRTSDKPIYPYYIKNKSSKKYIDIDSVQLVFPLRFSHIARTFQNQLEIAGTFQMGSVSNHILAGYSTSYMRRTSFSGYDLGKDVQGPGLNSVVSVFNPESKGPMTSRFSKASPTRMWVHGIYASDVMEFTQRLKGMLSFRYDWYDYRALNDKIPVIDGKRKFDDPASSEYGSTKSGSLSYRFGLVYMPMENLSVYSSVGSFYIPDRRIADPRYIYINADGKRIDVEHTKSIFKPTSGYQLELGARYEINNKLSAMVSGFYIRKNNDVMSLGTTKIMENGKEVSKRLLGQVASVNSKGFEVEVKYTPLPNLGLSAGYALNDVRVGEMKDNEYLKYNQAKNTPLNNVPKHNFYTYGSYAFDKGWIKGLSLNYALTYTGKIYRSYADNLYFEPYTLLNLGAEYQLPCNFTLGVNVNNVLNKKTYVGALNQNQLMPNAPTNFIVSLKYSL
ncbi:TonB-dependent receptor [Porphyromonas pogonae]|uniref:TonB-dependent receptor n=1 Tax=Porphyromonas pogonae TaxID=867595 RepID=UPI002E78F91C|nr:TonB-dependent receptor [Porphyromonas pogonae]